MTGGVTFPQLIDEFYAQSKALVEGGADMLLVETCQDTRNVKAALLAIERLRREIGRAHPDDGLGHHRADGHDARRARPRTRSAPRSRTPTCSRSA